MRAPGGPRLLLRRLREVMAEPVTAQARLDRIVVLIASNMVAEVCSLYVVRADGAMELFATEGLNRDAVHLTTMRARRRPGRPDRRERRAAGAFRRAASPGLFLPARDGRGNLPVVPRRAGPARRRDDRGPGGAEPRQAHLFGGGARGAADDRHAARRDDRVRGIAGDRGPGRGDRRAPAGVVQGSRHRRGAWPRACGHAPAAGDGVDDRRGRCGSGTGAAGDGDRRHARFRRRSDRPQRRRGRRRASRRARSVPHDRPRSRLAAPAARGGEFRSHCGGRGRAGP